MRLFAGLRHKFYTIILFFITVSGFAQMPIFKRYYIADIPGFGWLAQFYITHIIHYAAAVMLLIFVSYVLFDFIFTGRKLKNISKSGSIRVIIISGLIITGLLLIVKNLSGIYVGHTWIIVFDITHLMLCVFLVLVSFYSLITKKRWLGMPG